MEWGQRAAAAEREGGREKARGRVRGKEETQRNGERLSSNGRKKEKHKNRGELQYTDTSG